MTIPLAELIHTMESLLAFHDTQYARELTAYPHGLRATQRAHLAAILGILREREQREAAGQATEEEGEEFSVTERECDGLFKRRPDGFRI